MIPQKFDRSNIFRFFCRGIFGRGGLGVWSHTSLLECLWVPHGELESIAGEKGAWNTLQRLMPRLPNLGRKWMDG